MQPTVEQANEHPAGADYALRLEPSLQIKDVEAVRRLLVPCLEGDAPIRIDVSRLATLDTAGVQLLLAFRREGTHGGVMVEYCGESAALTRALTLLGLTEAVLGPAHHGR